jgi:hypothetical protein
MLSRCSETIDLMILNSLTVESAISSFGAAATAKLSHIAADGNPEDQLRAPFQQLLLDIAALSARNNVVLIGESSLADLSLRPDYAVAVDHALAGFVELKAPASIRIMLPSPPQVSRIC